MKFNNENLNILDEHPFIVYNYLLKKNVLHKNISLTEVANLTKSHGQKITSSYLSKLQNGKMPPPSYKVTLVLAKILQREPEVFLAASIADSDEYNRVELVQALKWAYPTEAEMQIQKRLERIFDSRFLNIEDSASTNLLKKSIFKTQNLSVQTMDNIEIKKVPVLSKLPFDTRYFSEDHVKEWIYEKDSKKSFFYLTANDDTMKANRIRENDKVLVDMEAEVNDGDIVVLNIKKNNGVIRRIKKVTNDQIIVYTGDPEMEPVIFKKNEIKIWGKVVKIEISF